MKYYSKQSVSSGRTLHYIKLFEKFDKDYIIDSIKDIFVELQDDNMSVDVIDRREFNNDITIKITNKSSEHTLDLPNVTVDITYDEYDEFSSEKIQDYVDMLKDFLEHCSITYNLHFELFNKEGNCTNKKTSNIDNLDKLGSVIIHITNINEN